MLGISIFNTVNTSSVSATANTQANAAAARHFLHRTKGRKSINTMSANPPMTAHTMRYTSYQSIAAVVFLGSFRTLARIKVNTGSAISNSVQIKGTIVCAETLCSTRLGYSVGA